MTAKKPAPQLTVHQLLRQLQQVEDFRRKESKEVRLRLDTVEKINSNLMLQVKETRESLSTTLREVNVQATKIGELERDNNHLSARILDNEKEIDLLKKANSGMSNRLAAMERLAAFQKEGGSWPMRESASKHNLLTLRTLIDAMISSQGG